MKNEQDSQTDPALPLSSISELADFRVNRVEDILKVGDLIWVKCIGVDEKGRVKLSRRAAMQERGESMGSAPAASMERGEGGGERGESRGGELREPRAEEAGDAPAAPRTYPEYRPGDHAPQQ